MKQIYKIAVLGSGGGTGYYVVNQLLAAFLVRQLMDDPYLRKAPFIVNK